MKRSTQVRGALFGVLAAFSVLSLPVLTSPAQAQTSIGVVDEDKLADGFKKYGAAVAAIDERAKDLDAKIPAREYLTTEEGKIFDAAIIKIVSPSAPANPALDALVKTGVARRNEYQNLIGKSPRSAEETARMGVLSGYATANRVVLSQLSDQLLQLVRQEQDSTDKQFTDRANEVVAQVAQERKMALIIRKKALIFSTDAVDVTNDVLKRLNQ